MFTPAAVIWPPPANSLRWSRATKPTVMTRPTSATGPSATANVAYGIREKLPIMMFCGLPVIVAVEPTLDAMATARR